MTTRDGGSDVSSPRVPRFVPPLVALASILVILVGIYLGALASELSDKPSATSATCAELAQFSAQLSPQLTSHSALRTTANIAGIFLAVFLGLGGIVASCCICNDCQDGRAELRKPCGRWPHDAAYAFFAVLLIIAAAFVLALAANFSVDPPPPFNINDNSTAAAECTDLRHYIANLPPLTSPSILHVMGVLLLGALCIFLVIAGIGLGVASVAYGCGDGSQLLPPAATTSTYR